MISGFLITQWAYIWYCSEVVFFNLVKQPAEQTDVLQFCVIQRLHQITRKCTAKVFSLYYCGNVNSDVIYWTSAEQQQCSCHRVIKFHLYIHFVICRAWRIATIALVTSIEFGLLNPQRAAAHWSALYTKKTSWSSQ